LIVLAAAAGANTVNAAGKGETAASSALNTVAGVARVLAPTRAVNRLTTGQFGVADTAELGVLHGRRLQAVEPRLVNEEFQRLTLLAGHFATAANTTTQTKQE
jgi:hypothetical protein